MVLVKVLTRGALEKKRVFIIRRKMGEIKVFDTQNN
jgi:hypothetical protein